MNCPVCSVALERKLVQQVEIDECPECKGVWFEDDELRKAKDREHILEGLKIAVDNIDEVIKIIRGSEDTETASIRLRAAFDLSEKQAEAIHGELLRELPEDSSPLEIGDVVYRTFMEEAGEYSTGAADEYRSASPSPASTARGGAPSASGSGSSPRLRSRRASAAQIWS